jgi:hypothetical protein
MDYLFYGDVQVSKEDPSAEVSTISLSINCDPDERIAVYGLYPTGGNGVLRDQSMQVSRTADHAESIFTVNDDMPFIFMIEAKSNKSPISCRVSYIVARGEVIALPDNEVVKLDGAIFVF